MNLNCSAVHSGSNVRDLVVLRSIPSDALFVRESLMKGDGVVDRNDVSGSSVIEFRVMIRQRAVGE
jgi:hypothetical protein